MGARLKKRDPQLPARIRALLRVQAAEDQVHAALRHALAAWLPAARAAVVPGGVLTASAQPIPPNPDALFSTERDLLQAATQHLRPVLDEVFGKAFAQSAREAVVANQRYQEAYTAHVTQAIQDISATTRRQIEALVREGVANGYGVASIAKGVEQALTMDGQPPRYAMLFAQAESDGAEVAVRRRHLQSIPLDDRDAQWREAMDEVEQLRQRARNEADQARTAMSERGHAWEARAQSIARTETMTAVNGGTLSGMQARAGTFGIPLRKRWLATHDDRTREDHMAADGQEQPLDHPFVVGGAQMQHPGDPGAPADQVIQCRCTIMEVLEGEVYEPGEAPYRNDRNRAAPAAPEAAEPSATASATPAVAAPTGAASSTLSSSPPEGADVTASTRTRPGRRRRNFADAPPAPAAAPAAGPAPSAPTTPEMEPWTAVLAVEGTPTGDGRMFAANSLTWRELPLPLMSQLATAMGHDTAVCVGRIDTIERDGNLIRAAGVFLAGDPSNPQDAVTLTKGLIQNKALRGVSVDVDDMEIEFPELDPISIGEDEMAEGDDLEDVMIATEARIMAATIVATPAFAECVIQLGTDPATPAAPTDPSAPARPDDTADTAPAEEPPAVAAAASDGTAPADAPAAGDTAPGDGSDAPPAGGTDEEPASITKQNGEVLTVGDPILAIITLDGVDTPVEGYITAIDGTGGTCDLQLEDGTPQPGIDAEKVFLDADEVDGDGTDEGDGADSGTEVDALPAAGGPGSIMVSPVTAPVLIAAGAPAPPREWFTDPGFGADYADDPRLHEQLGRDGEPTGRFGCPLTVTDDGQVYGHIALWGTCHTGIGNVCVTPPSSPSKYAHFHLGETPTDTGERIATGRITLGGGHADRKLGYQGALSHYDDAGAGVCDVVAGEDGHGIWVAGSLSNIGPAAIAKFSSAGIDDWKRALLGSKPSGDWRRINGALELMAVLCVNVPGFPVQRRALAASVGGVQVSLVAAGMVTEWGAPREPSVEETVKRFLARRQRAQQLAASIGRDPATRLEELVASVRAATGR